MKPTRTKSLSPIMERHTPQHPLPEEIKSLPQDETVCQFCGVSYLIHHEIKKLEELVERLEKELEENRGAVEREQKLRSELEKAKDAVEYLNQILKQNEETITKITSEVEEVKTLNEKLHVDVTSEQEKRNGIANDFLLHKQKVKSFFNDFQTDTRSLKRDLAELRSDSLRMKDDVTLLVADAISKIPKVAEACTREHSTRSGENEKLKSELESASSEIDSWKAKALKTDAEISSLRERLSLNEATNAKSDRELKRKIEELEKHCAECARDLNVAEMQVNSLKSDAALMDDKLKKKQSELQNVVFKLQKSEENATDTVRRMSQECRDMERELALARSEVARLREAQKEREKREEELSQQANLSCFQFEEVKKALSEAKAANKSLMEERNLMVLSHQNQIQQLRDNFKRILAERDGTVRAEQELEAEREKHRIALESLERSLKGEFRIELDVEKDKHSEALLSMRTEHRDEIRKLEERHQQAMTSYKNEVATLKKQLESTSQRTDAKEAECEEEKASLKHLINQLETRITQLTGENEDSVALNRLEAVSTNQKLRDTLKENERLQEDIISMKEEVSLLQETVRRECEERFELTEALGQARQQLKEGKGYHHSLANSANPVSAVNKLNPGAIEAEIGSKLSNRTLRSLESDYSSPTPIPLRNGSVPSLRSLPDVLPRRDHNPYYAKPLQHHEANAVSTSITDIGFASREIPPRRSSSNSSIPNGHSAGRTNSHSGPGRSKSLGQSESAESVDHARKRIAAAIKRK